MKRPAMLFYFVGFVLLTAVPAFATTITFTHIGLGSGTLDGTPFTTSDFTITAQGDTDNRDTFSGGYYIDHDFASISITGLGTYQFTTGTRTFVNNLGLALVGFSREGEDGKDLLWGPYDAAFATWDMLSPIGPITGGGELFQWGLSPSVVTNAGVLVFNNSRFEAATFKASVFEATSVPEPSTIVLLGSGLLGMVGFGRKKFT